MRASRGDGRAFLDSSVIIAALLSARGASFEIIRTATTFGWRLMVNQFVVDEVISVTTEKFPDKLGGLPFILGALEVLDDRPEAEVLRLAKLINPTDAPVLAGALRANVRFLLSLDQHFFTDLVISHATKRGVTVMRPGLFLRMERSSQSDQQALAGR